MSANDALECWKRPERWHAALDRLQRAGEPHALASLVSAAGSTPREPGAKLVVTRDDVIDTLGGGHFEQQIVELARARLTAMPVVAETCLEAFPLGGRSGQCCGGFVHVLIEIFPGTEQRLALFGAGHVGQALVQILAPLPWRIDWYDTRKEAMAAMPALDRVTAIRWTHQPGSLATVTAAIPAQTHVLIMTHDHAQDRDLIAALARRDDLASLGMIGSTSKWASFQRRLLAEGVGADQLARVRCPIGRPSGRLPDADSPASGKRPHEIAICVAAELLTLVPAAPRQDRRGVSPDALRDAFSSSEPVAGATAGGSSDQDR
ncbi:xanthine dehydrogenase accessory protein XdhC [Salinicola rhizosphaerae]|uniref:Xanthine dehydrogenase accessory protein XdhC n=1 Tax=Salinicola rhizosphaerae TaxID=1443141 RepID=A0ABQ3DP21_9GAMM|nr:xanthine dehydrogenase accessory protein XdhC [Salinicola rhizosphaerae]GHB10023.1 xanthine dehydrogenase accessory protein XdhC [Salinicola rhizosphaerae]